MNFNAFLLLPDSEEAVFNIIQGEKVFTDFINTLASTVKLIRSLDKSRLYFDSTNISAFLGHCTEFDQEPYLRKVQYQLQNIINRFSIDIKTKPLIDHNCLYVLWNYNKIPIVNCNPPSIIAELVERKFQYPTEKYMLLNMNESVEACRKYLLAFKDAKHLPKLPSDFIKIPFVIDQDELDLWLTTNHVEEFSLFDRGRFVKTSYTSQGKAIYQEISKRYYWYLDNLHKDHYEVFDRTGKHLGEANLLGELDTEKKVEVRTITL